MSIVKIGDKEFVPYIPTDQIDEAVRRVARSIDECYASNAEPVLMIITLSGAMMFAADLNRHCSTPFEWAFVKCSSYGSSMQSSGNITFDVPLSFDIEERDVLVVEDIVDSGNTWQAMHAYFSERNPRSLRIATLSIKRDVYDKELPVDFVALEVEDKFVVGYGMDYDQKGRSLNGIYKPASC